jgi:DNA adenine methylase
MSEAIKRPLFRYHGSKWLLAPWIISHFPKHRIYVEPYGGSASLLVRKPRSWLEVYNDVDEDVVALFQVLRSPRQAKRLRDLVELTPFSRKEFEAVRDPGEVSQVERARCLIARSVLGFGSAAYRKGYKTGFRAHFWRKTGSPANELVGRAPVVEKFADRFKAVIIECKPALDVIEQQDTPDTLFYLDPPYVKSTRRSARECYAKEMTDQEHRDLAAVLRGIKGKAIVSGYASPLYDELFKGWRRVAKKFYASSTPARGISKRLEVLWMNFT